MFVPRYVPPRPQTVPDAEQTLSRSDAELHSSKKRKRKDKEGDEATKKNRNRRSDGLSIVEVATELKNKKHKKKHASAQHEEATTQEQRAEQINEENGEHRSEEIQESQRSAIRVRRKDKHRQMHELEQQADQETDSPSKAHSRILQKFEKSTQFAQEHTAGVEEPEEEEEKELRDFVPIPRPKAAAGAFAKPNFSALPSWLSEPLEVPLTHTAPFPELGVATDLVEKLRTEGYEAALPVQAAVLPLLLPTPHQYPGDVCVSAATGSGKTVAYVLPIIQSLKYRLQTQLRALLVVPTRELVSQVRKVADMCAKGTDLRIGTAVGSHTLKMEQDNLVQQSQKYDPEGWQDLSRLLNEPADDLRHSDDAEYSIRVQEALRTLPGHVPEYLSKVDILICTPGRLVDHIKSTRGFSLQHLEWLVIDEADRLLDQSFQDWAQTVNGALHVRDPSGDKDSSPVTPFRRGVRKVMLSATMTSDLSQLDALKLQNPKLTVVGGVDAATRPRDLTRSTAMSLPPTLEEHAVPVGDGSDKPLYLMQLLDVLFKRTSTFSRGGGLAELRKPKAQDGSDEEDSDVSSVVSSDSSSVASPSSPSSSTSSSSSSTTSSVSQSSSSSLEPHSASDSSPASSPSVKSLQSSSQPAHTQRSTKLGSPLDTVLVFTASNEAALRLSSLLRLLGHGRVATITKGSSGAATRAALMAFGAGDIDVVVASDRVARGLDFPGLAHVVNYDIPHSQTSYVHRAGRTARAGRLGRVWTLIEAREARWFWRELANTTDIERPSGRAVQRTRLAGAIGDNGKPGWDTAARDQYVETLAKLKKEVVG